VTIVMGLDQHRAQITVEWIDTSTGELSRCRIAPADRSGVRRFAARFRGQELEVALEATTGWRFVVEELQAVGVQVHLAEPAETAAGVRAGRPGDSSRRAYARRRFGRGAQLASRRELRGARRARARKRAAARTTAGSSPS
jgi:hypothetical protein